MRVRRIDAADLPGLCREGWVDTKRGIFREGNTAFVPVRDGYPCDEILPERAPYCGRGYFLLGDIAVVHGDHPTEEEVAAITDWSGARSILHLDAVAGEQRIPEVSLLAGTGGDVVHRENGITYHLDPAQVMFAQGNRVERARMGAAVRQGERVGDLFAGVGYFTLPMARAGARIHAMELNPVAFHYLRRNLAENNCGGQVEAELGDCRRLLNGIYDRLVLGHFHAEEFLPHVLGHVRSGTVLHVHGIAPGHGDVRDVFEAAGFSSTINERKVKKYAPGKWHVVQDVILQ